ncbi:MAG: YddF family protein [Cellulosilyticaceae bacterium]
MSETQSLPIALLNGTVATTDGIYAISSIEVEQIKALIKQYGFISAIGHEATAALVSDVLEINIPYNRIAFSQQVSQKAVVFKLNERPPEGVILDRKAIEAIGFTFKMMERLE